MKISVVIPVYNEEKILLETKEELYNFCKLKFTDGFEIIFSDDGSRDASRSLLDSFQEEEIRVIGESENRGKGYAVRKGILHANGDVIIFTDCDLAYGVAILADFVKRMEENEDVGVLIGSRALHKDGYEGYSLFRRFLSHAYMRFLSVVGGIRTTDSQSGIKAFRKSDASRIFSLCESNRFAFDCEVLMIADRLHIKILEHPVKIINNRPSSMSFLRDSLKMVRDVLKIKKRVKKIKTENM